MNAYFLYFQGSSARVRYACCMNVRLVHAIIFGLNQKAFTYFLRDIHKLHYLKELGYRIDVI